MKQLLCKGRSSKTRTATKKRPGESLLRTLPSVGRLLAERMQRTLGATQLKKSLPRHRTADSKRVPGFGMKRLRSIRENLASRLQVGRPLYPLSVDGVSKRRRRAVEFGGAGLLKVSRVI